MKYFTRSLSNRDKVNKLIIHLQNTRAKDINYKKLLEYVIEDVLYDEKENELWDKNSIKIVGAGQDNGPLVITFTKKDLYGPEDIAITYIDPISCSYCDTLLHTLNSNNYLDEQETEELIHICRTLIYNTKIPYKRTKGFFAQNQYKDMEDNNGN